MKKTNGRSRLITVLLAIHELLLIIIGMGLAFMIELGKLTNGAALIIPMAIVLIILGWMLRGAMEDTKN